MTARTLTLCAALLGACGGANPKNSAPALAASSDAGAAAAGDEVSPGDQSPRDRLVDLFGRLQTALAQSGDSCADFTSTLKDWLAEYGDEIRDLLIMDLPDSDWDVIDESITAAATDVVFPASECGSDDAAYTAYSEFDALVL